MGGLVFCLWPKRQILFWNSGIGSPIDRLRVNRQQRFFLARVARKGCFTFLSAHLSVAHPSFLFIGCAVLSNKPHQSPIRIKAGEDLHPRAPLAGFSRPRKRIGTRLPPSGLLTDLWLFPLLAKRQPLPGWQPRRLASTHTGGPQPGCPIRSDGFANPYHGLTPGGPKLFPYPKAFSSLKTSCLFITQ